MTLQRHMLILRRGLVCLGALLLSACAGQMAHRAGTDLIAEGNYEAGLAKLQEATKEEPGNLEYRLTYRSAQDRIVSGLLTAAQRSKTSGQYAVAAATYRRVLGLAPGNAQAIAGLATVEQAERLNAVLVEATSLFASKNYEGAEQKVLQILTENPQHSEARALRRQIDEKSSRHQTLSPALRKSFRQTVSLEFRDISLKLILEALSRHSGLNFVLDKEVQGSATTTVFLRNVTVEDALDVLLSTLQLRRQVLNDSTLLIYPNTAAKQSEHQDLVVKTFYLANANAKQVMEMLKLVLKPKAVYVDEKLNLLIMRDTPESIRLAERLVATQDVNEPEVMLEVEVLEIQRSKLLNLGIQFPDQLTLTPLASSGSGDLTLQDLKDLKSSTTGVAISPLIINLQDQVNDSNVLANPRIRTRNREKAEIKIGDRVPVITTTSTSTGFVSNSVQYIDVGLKLEVEPTIYPDDQVAIKLNLEVSSVTKQLTAADGTTVYQIGSRNASTLLRLKDNETQILGGLINDFDTKSANRFPGLGDLPMLGRLFASQKDNTQKSELVLSITPHLVRGLTPPLQSPTEFWSGTENNPRLKQLVTRNETGGKTDVDVAPRTENAPVAPPSAPGAANDTAAGVDSATGPADIPQPGAAPPLLHWSGIAQSRVGEQLALTLNTSSEQAFASLPLKVRYDPAVFEIVDVMPGGLLVKGGTNIELSKRIDSTAGMVEIVVGSPAAEGVKGDGELVTLKLRALAPSQSTMITALPSLPVGNAGLAFRETGPAAIGLSIAP